MTATKKVTKTKAPRVWIQELILAYSALASFIASKSSSDPQEASIQEAPVFAAKAMLGLVKSEAESCREVRAIFNAAPTVVDTQILIAHGPVSVPTLCLHHMSPMSYEVYVAYYTHPSMGPIVQGHSLSAVVTSVCSLPMTADVLAKYLADTLHYTPGLPRPSISTAGAAVTIKQGKHPCSFCAAASNGATSSATVFTGAMDTAKGEAAFYSAISNLRQV